MLREPAERSEFLITACDVDERLRLEVETLIAAEMLGTHKSRVTPGEQIDNFGIVRQLGVGGMGEVYLANDTRLNRKAALKLLENGGHLQKFKRCS